VEALLAQAVDYPLTLVVAGAGYGKTRAVYSFLRHHAVSATWVQLTDDDNQSARFWENYTQALTRRNAAVAGQMAAAGFPLTAERFARYVALMDDMCAPADKYILVLDDFHRLRDGKVLNFIEALIHTPLPNTATVIISRTEPAVHTVSMMAKGRAAVVAENALRFTEEEISEYLSRLPGETTEPPPPRSIALIRRETDGWALAVDSVCRALKKNVGLTEAIGAMRLSAQTLIERELAPATPELRRFLISLSLLSHLPQDFLQNWAADEHLRAMEQYSAFIRFDAYLDSYRLHPLLLAWLRERSGEISAADKQAVYLRAAEWSLARRAWLDAIGYYEKAGDYQNMSLTVSNLPLVLPRATAEFLLPLVSDLPQAVLQATPRLYIIRIRCLFALERYDEALTEIAAIASRHGPHPDDPEINRLLCHCHLNLAFIKIFTCSFTHDYTFPADFTQAEEYYVQGGFIPADVPANNFMLSMFINQTGRAEAGSLESYITALDAAIPCLSHVLPGCGAGLNNLARAEAAYMRADMNNCVKFALQAMFRAAEMKQYEIENRAVFFLLGAALFTGDYESIRLNRLRLQKMLTNEDYVERAAHYDIVAGWYYALLGQTGHVADWLKMSPTGQNSAPSARLEFANLTRYICYLADQRHDELLACLQAYRENDCRRLCLPARLELLTLEAVVRFRLKQKKAALDLLQKAYELAAPNAIEIFFINKGADMRALTAAALKNPRTSIPAAWLQKINRKASTFSKKIQFISQEYKKEYHLGDRISLSPRETELLRALTDGRSRLQIAGAMNMSLSMVKSAIILLEEKIGAENQRDAIRIALEQKLI
jgi:LuxR family maltose regulon positive regulatory protein